MFRSPMSPASVCTSRRNSSRSAISSGDNCAVTKTLFPGIRTPNHHNNAMMAATALTIRRELNKMRGHISADLFAERERAEQQKKDAALHRHVKEKVSRDQDDRDLDVAD